MITKDDVNSLSYVDLLAHLVESNRPPGGISSIRRIVAASHLRSGMSALHAGCNAGFLSRELTRRSGARVLGIDISNNMIAAARQRAQEEGLSHMAEYLQADMRALPFPAGTFDLVVSGGALAFVESSLDHAIDEWIRVAKPHGLIADAELFYHMTPPSRVARAVADIIGTSVTDFDLNYWLSLFKRTRLETYYKHIDTRSQSRGAVAVLNYVQRLIRQSRAVVASDAIEPLEKRLCSIFETFDRNMEYLGVLVVVLVVRPENSEPSLYP